jgi:cytochrome c556
MKSVRLEYWNVSSFHDQKGFFMRRTVILASLLALGTGVALAQSAAIAERKQLFKAMGGAAGPMGKMLRGEEAFDLTKVQAGLKVIAENNLKVAKLFPADSQTGGETKVLPSIWTDKAKFDAIFPKLDAAVAAAATAIKDEASFKAEIPKVLGNCGACHNDFRQKNN